MKYFIMLVFHAKYFLFFKFLRLIQEELVKKRWLLQPVKPTTATVPDKIHVSNENVLSVLRMIVYIERVYQELKIIYNNN